MQIRLRSYSYNHVRSNANTHIFICLNWQNDCRHRCTQNPKKTFIYKHHHLCRIHHKIIAGTLLCTIARATHFRQQRNQRKKWCFTPSRIFAFLFLSFFLDRSHFGWLIASENEKKRIYIYRKTTSTCRAVVT